MAKLFLLLALCVLPAMASALAEPLYVRGKCYCDYCRVGFEVNPSKYIGCTVQLVCRERNNPDQITYRKTVKSASHGAYEITVERDCGDEICEVSPLESTEPKCSTPADSGSRVTLTHNNGIASNVRFANNLAFVRDAPLASCPQILQQYNV